MNWLSLVALFLQLANAQTATSPLDRIREKINVAPVTDLAALRISGQYKNPSNELIKRVGPPLGGDNLYVFPDNTYIYCEWGDVMENTVFDKGTWSFSESVLRLKSSPDVTWDSRLERTFLAVRRASRPKEILLVGIEKKLPYFETHADDDAELMLLIVAKQRENMISRSEAARLKADLIRTAWRPDFFRNEH